MFQRNHAASGERYTNNAISASQASMMAPPSSSPPSVYNHSLTHPHGAYMREPLELKKTINLPKTDFSMRANLPVNEPKWLEQWRRTGFTGRFVSRAEDAPPTSCMTG